MSSRERDLKFLAKAIELSRQGMQGGKGGPFGCVVVKGDEIIGEGWNQVTSTNDPTAHSEVVAIRQACQHLNSFQLDDCEIFSSCEPCPMCLGAIYWARPKRVVFANTREQAASIEFDDDFIYDQIEMDAIERNIPFEHLAHPEAEKVFNEWKNLPGKIRY
jgi:tRNA(Arg) A34 adenosine deaminase TadA